MGLEEKNLLTLAPGKLVNEASAGSGLLTPFEVVTALAGMIFVRLPLTIIVALRVNVQVPVPERLPPLKEKEPAPGTPLSVPPHVPTLKFRGLARIMPVGMVSVKAMPVRATVPELINWMLIVEAAPPKTVSGSKPLTSVTDKLLPPLTVKLEIRLPPGTRFSLLVIFAGEIVLVCDPSVLLVTYTSILHRWLARISPLVKVTAAAPLGASSTAAAPQPVTVGGVELLTVTPAGRLSVTEKFVRFVSLGAKISILNCELPPMTIEDGENDFIPATSVPLTITFAIAGRRLPSPSSVVSPPTEIVFVNVPEDVPPGAITSTEMVQVPGAVGLPAGIVPPTKLILVDDVETVPPHVFACTLTTVNGAGKLSVKFTPVYGEAVGFCRVITRVVVSPADIVDGENCFAIPIACVLNCEVAAVVFVAPSCVWSESAGMLLV